MAKKGFYQKVYNVVKKIPYGKVASYGMIARAIGAPGAAKLVGYALHSLPTETDVPWHRVVSAKGLISLYKLGILGEIQREMLEREGIVVNEFEQIDMERYAWKGINNSKTNKRGTYGLEKSRNSAGC